MRFVIFVIKKKIS